MATLQSLQSSDPDKRQYDKNHTNVQAHTYMSVNVSGKHKTSKPHKVHHDYCDFLFSFPFLFKFLPISLSKFHK